MAQQRLLSYGSLPFAILFTILVVCPALESARAQEENPTTAERPELTIEEQQAMQEIMELREQLGGGLSQQFEGLLDPEPGGGFDTLLRSVIQNRPQSGGPQTVTGQSGTGATPNKNDRRSLSRHLVFKGLKGDLVFRSGDRVNLVDTGNKAAVTLLESVEIHSVFPSEPDTQKSAGGSVSVRFLVNPEQAAVIEGCSNRSHLRMVHGLPAVSQQAGTAGPLESPSTELGATFSKSKIQQLRQVARELDRVASDLEDLEMYVDADGLRLKAQQLRSVARLKNDTTDIIRR